MSYNRRLNCLHYAIGGQTPRYANRHVNTAGAAAKTQLISLLRFKKFKMAEFLFSLMLSFRCRCCCRCRCSSNDCEFILLLNRLCPVLLRCFYQCLARLDHFKICDDVTTTPSPLPLIITRDLHFSNLHTEISLRTNFQPDPNIFVIFEDVADHALLDRQTDICYAS